MFLKNEELIVESYIFDITFILENNTNRFFSAYGLFTLLCIVTSSRLHITSSTRHSVLPIPWFSNWDEVKQEWGDEPWMCLFSSKFFPHMTQISAFPLSSINFILMETIPLLVGYLLDVGHSIHSNVDEAHELISLERLLHFSSCI